MVLALVQRPVLLAQILPCGIPSSCFWCLKRFARGLFLGIGYFGMWSPPYWCLVFCRTQAEMAHTCRGTINLSTAHIDTEDSCNIVLSNGGRTYHLKASSEVERQRWVTALELAKAKAIRMRNNQSGRVGAAQGKEISKLCFPPFGVRLVLLQSACALLPPDKCLVRASDEIVEAHCSCSATPHAHNHILHWVWDAKKKVYPVLLWC